CRWRVRGEGQRSGMFRIVAELFVGERALGLRVDNGRPGGVEEPDPAPVHVAAALHDERVRRVDQPERRADRVPPRVEPQQPAHDAIPSAEGHTTSRPSDPENQCGAQITSQTGPSPYLTSTSYSSLKPGPPAGAYGSRGRPVPQPCAEPA